MDSTKSSNKFCPPRSQQHDHMLKGCNITRGVWSVSRSRMMRSQSDVTCSCMMSVACEKNEHGSRSERVSSVFTFSVASLVAPSNRLLSLLSNAWRIWRKGIKQWGKFQCHESFSFTSVYRTLKVYRSKQDFLWNVPKFYKAVHSSTDQYTDIIAERQRRHRSRWQ